MAVRDVLRAEHVAAGARTRRATRCCRRRRAAAPSAGGALALKDLRGVGRHGDGRARGRRRRCRSRCATWAIRGRRSRFQRFDRAAGRAGRRRHAGRADAGRRGLPERVGRRDGPGRDRAGRLRGDADRDGRRADARRRPGRSRSACRARGRRTPNTTPNPTGLEDDRPGAVSAASVAAQAADARVPRAGPVRARARRAVGQHRRRDLPQDRPRRAGGSSWQLSVRWEQLHAGAEVARASAKAAGPDGRARQRDAERPGGRAAAHQGAAAEERASKAIDGGAVLHAVAAVRPARDRVPVDAPDRPAPRVRSGHV